MLANRFVEYIPFEHGTWAPLVPPVTISVQYLRSCPPVDGTIKLPDRNQLVYALKCDDGRVWDAINGWHP